MPDWTAITGIVVAGVVGPAVGALWERSRQGRQFHHEVAMRDVAELRLLLDDAAQSLERVDHARGAAYGRILQEGRYSTEAGREATNRFRSKVAALSVLKARLSIRLGETDSLHQLFSDALTALVQVLDAIDLAAFQGERADMVKINERMEAGEADFKKVRAAFLEEAVRQGAATRLAIDLRSVSYLQGMDTQTVTPEDTQPLLSPAEAARLANVSTKTIRREIDRGALPALPAGRLLTLSDEPAAANEG